MIARLSAALTKQVEKFMDSNFADYDFLLTMPFQSRFYAAVGYGLLNIVIGMVLHLGLVASGKSTPERVLISYCWIILVITWVCIVLLRPELRKSNVFAVFLMVIFVIQIVLFIRVKIFDSLDWLGLGVFMGAALCLTIGLKYYNKAMRAIVDERTRIESERTQLRSEARSAQQIQKKLVPVRSLTAQKYCLFGASFSATEVGGDYFDVVSLDTVPESSLESCQLAIAVGDVSGHNMAAGLLVAMLKSAFRTELKHCNYEHSLVHLLQALNSTIIDNTDKGLFVSFQCAVLDFDQKTMVLANAGHLPVLLWRNYDFTRLQPKGMALGLAKQGAFHEQTIQLEARDVLVFLTDGIIEAMNEKREEFGMDRLVGVLRAALEAELPPEEVAKQLFARVREFMGIAGANDDMTVIVAVIA